MIDWLSLAPVWESAAVLFTVFMTLSLSVLWVLFHVGKSWKIEISPGLFTPVSMTFGLIIGFMASQVWSDNSRAMSAVMREASAVKTIIAISEALPEKQRSEIEGLVRDYVDHVVNVDWPAMQSPSSHQGMIDNSSRNALKYTLLITPQNATQTSAQSQLLTAFNALYESRSERLIFSGTSVNPLKWALVSTFALILIIVTSLVHRSGARNALIALSLLSCALTLSFLLILTHDRPFAGYVSITPDLLIRALPDTR